MNRLPDTYFDALYEDTPDPWGFTDRWYERRKRALSLAALPERRYRNAFEPGCSIGVLSAQLAERCDRLLATDVSAQALAAAATRVPDHVSLRRWALGDPWPAEAPFDLVVVSEVLYYLEAPLLDTVVLGLPHILTPGGTVLAVHWRHDVEDYPVGGDAVHASLAAVPGLARLGGYADDDVLVEVFVRTPPEPVALAAREGLH